MHDAFSSSLIALGFAALLVLPACDGEAEAESHDAGHQDGTVLDTGTPQDAGKLFPNDVQSYDTYVEPLPSTPHEVECSSEECTTPEQVCCVEATSDGGSKLGCVEGGTSCSGRWDRVIGCDEQADCPDGGICCDMWDRGLVCVPPEDGRCPLGDDEAPGIQYCRTDAECPRGTPCITHNCRSGRIATCGPTPLGYCGEIGGE